MKKGFKIVYRIFRLRKTKKKSGVKKRKYVKKEFAENKEKARLLAESRVVHFNQFYNFQVNKITIRDSKTRWGSCSRKGNLNFNYKIALIPEKLADYIIVHEICHLGEFNHSKNFWDLVAQVVPDYAECRHALKTIKI